MASCSGGLTLLSHSAARWAQHGPALAGLVFPIQAPSWPAVCGGPSLTLELPHKATSRRGMSSWEQSSPEHGGIALAWESWVQVPAPHSFIT